MIGLREPWPHKWVAAKVNRSPLKWISVNSTKPNRDNSVSAIVVHSCNDWAEANIDRDIVEVETLMIENFQKLTKIDCSDADYISTHRWRFANAANDHPLHYYFDDKINIAAIGDWASRSNVEDLWDNSHAFATELIENINS